MQNNLWQQTVERLLLLEEVYPCQFRVINYYIGHQRLIIVASHLDDIDRPMLDRRRAYLECELVYYMQVVPEWESIPIQLWDEKRSANFIKSIGLFRDLRSSYVPLVLGVDTHTPEIVIACNDIYVHRERPASSDYPDL